MFFEESRVKNRLGRVAFVVLTGGSSGIGAEFLKALQGVAPNAVICNLSRSRPGAFTEGEHCRHFACDLEKVDDIHRVAGELVALMSAGGRPGRVLLINNSGFGAYGEFPEPSPGHNASMIDLNVRAPVLLTGLLWPELMRRGADIINVASLAAFQPTPFLSAYAASKAFVLHWSVAVDAEGRRHGIRALALCPGPTPSNFFRRAGFGEAPVPGYGTTARQVVDSAFRGLVRGDVKVVPGVPFKLLAWVSGSVPLRFSAWLGRHLMARLRLKPLRAANRVR